MVDRVDEHCPECKFGGEKCECPCHTWKHRRCGCGGIMELITFQTGVRVKLNGTVIPHIKVYYAKCNKCGVKYERKSEMMADEE